MPRTTPPTQQELSNWLDACQKQARRTIRALRQTSDAGTWCILDTETTGLDPHCAILELAILDPMGAVLVDTVIRPTPHDLTWDIDSDPPAHEIHGITAAEIQEAPRWSRVHGPILKALAGRRIVCWNKSFDAPRLYRQFRRAGLDYPGFEWTCAMRLYAELHRLWSDKHDDFAYVKLADAYADVIGSPSENSPSEGSTSEGSPSEDGELRRDPASAHRAAADAETTRLVLSGLAGQHA